ncbi:ParB N-terminal domain-containing protein [Christensenella minuta]|uniref:ParB N-terminal domain-containing protein n=1 Tax=Christensenella minuta TaxID=626937 RepID=UPI0021583D5A|nr:ParB N-terminal domain-containing protein [Christensenella minuta]
MRNTGLIYDSTEQTPAISPAFADLLPPLSDEQYAALETDILQNGCYSPIIVNEDMAIVDGHHRQAICEKHGVSYRMAVFAFEDDLEAQRWALDTQKARRNLSAWELGQVALKLKPELEAKAKETQGERTDLFQNSEKGSSKSNTTKELADVADVSTDTMNKIIQIDERAPAPVKDALDNGDLSVNAGYNITRLLEKLPEEAREAAAERAVDLAKQRKDYKAAFDISLSDMNALTKEDEEAADTIRAALNDGALSVNGGKEVARTLLEMPEDVRESAVADAEGLAELEADYRKKSQTVDDNADIAKAYNAAFACMADIDGAERDVRIWIEWAGIRKDEISGLIEEAKNAAELFSQIVKTLRKVHEQEVMPYEDAVHENRPEQG